MILEILPNQASQVTQMIAELQGAQFLNVLSRITVGGLAVLLTLASAILVARTAAGTLNSRFLRHLAISLIINMTGALVTIAYLLLKAALAFFVLGKVEENSPVAASFVQALETLNSASAGSAIIISLLSNVFLFAAWNLLRRYPNQGVNKSFYAILMVCFGSGSLLVVATNLLIFLEKIQSHLWQVFHFIDLTSSAIALLLVGWQLQKSLGPRMKTENSVLKGTLPWVTFTMYFIWGISQLVYEHLKVYSWYSALLLAASFAAVIMTIILCSQALEEKPEYSTIRAS